MHSINLGTAVLSTCLPFFLLATVTSSTLSSPSLFGDCLLLNDHDQVSMIPLILIVQVICWRRTKERIPDHHECQTTNNTRESIGPDNNSMKLQISDLLRQKTQSWVFSKRLKGFSHASSSSTRAKSNKNTQVFVANSFSIDKLWVFSNVENPVSLFEKTQESQMIWNL
jgi:hypothetical protein